MASQVLPPQGTTPPLRSAAGSACSDAYSPVLREDRRGDPTSHGCDQAHVEVGRRVLGLGGSPDPDVLLHLLHLGPEVRSALIALASDPSLQASLLRAARRL